MNTRHLSVAPVLVRLAVIGLLLTACGPAAATGTPEATQPPAATETAGSPSGMLALDYSALAQDVTLETIPAQPPSADAPSWAAGPAYHLFTLQGYPVTNHLLKPQIFVYPVADMASFNESMAGIAADLHTLLQTREPGENLPFLPLFNAAQVMHAQVQFLDFKNGTGVRYLTQFDQAPLPINNYELIYTFQGLTSDGSYYVAAVLPVTHPDLPADATVNEDLINDFQGYLAQAVTMLNEKPADSFVPDLNTIDTVMRSMEVK